MERNDMSLRSIEIISSCYVIQGPDRTESELNPTNEYHSISDDNAEFKIHRPGEAIDSPETLEWSPNNLTELATMQFTILLDNNLPLDTIEQIDIIGAWISNSGQAFEQFQESITGFTINQGPNICLLYTSDAADERRRVDLGGRRIIKKIF